MINLKYTEEQKKKEAFYCSDYGKLAIDLYYGFTGETKTNPILWTDLLRMSAGKGVELQMLDILKDNGIVDKEYIQETHGRVDMQREGVNIHGYIDAITCANPVENLLGGCPIEIKTINNKNSWDIKRYEAEEPRENYVGQLACYMNFLGKDIGYLFVTSIDGLNTFWFECRKVGEGLYRCGKIEINLFDEYKRWSKIYESVKSGVEPDVGLRYKIPVNEVDWKSLSKTEISKARNGERVVGDEESWKISYSPWKDKIIEKLGCGLGYSDEELKIINELTKGYTTWKN